MLKFRFTCVLGGDGGSRTRVQRQRMGGCTIIVAPKILDRTDKGETKSPYGLALSFSRAASRRKTYPHKLRLSPTMETCRVRRLPQKAGACTIRPLQELAQKRVLLQQKPFRLHCLQLCCAGRVYDETARSSDCPCQTFKDPCRYQIHPRFADRLYRFFRLRQDLFPRFPLIAKCSYAFHQPFKPLHSKVF